MRSDAPRRADRPTDRAETLPGMKPRPTLQAAVSPDYHSSDSVVLPRRAFLALISAKEKKKKENVIRRVADRGIAINNYARELFAARSSNRDSHSLDTMEGWKRMWE